MPRTFTLGALVTRAQQRADLVNHDNVGTSEWKESISSAMGELQSLLVGSGLRYFESVQSVSSAALTDNGDGGGYIAMPADHAHTIGVDLVDGTGYRTPLYEMMVQERSEFSGSTGFPHAIAWAHQGANLVLYPRPASGQTYKHHYVPQPTDLSSSADGTNVDVVTNDGENFVVWYAAALAMAKQGRTEEAAFAVVERDRAKERVREDALRRALNNARRVVTDDTDRPTSWWWGRRY